MRTPGRLRAGLLSLLLLCGLAAGCDGSTPPLPAPLTLDWTRLDLPMPPGPPGRTVLRDVTVCDGHWYAVGAITAPDGATRPAAWASTDGSTWRALSMSAHSFYGKISTVYAAGCREGVLAAIGAQTGGAHGYPRVNTWQQRSDGSMIEVDASSFELYGGPKAVNVSRIVGGPTGWIMAGNRSSGAASWVSADASDFAIVEGAPALAGDSTGQTWSADVVATAGGWTMVGGFLPVGRIDRDPVAWTSPDGVTWQRLAVPGDPVAYDELQRVAVAGDGLLAVGLRGQRFGAWRSDPDGWHATGTFGAAATGTVASARSLAVLGGTAYAAVSDGRAHRLWRSTDAGATWGEIVAPGPTTAGSGRATALAAADGRIVLVLDDGNAAGLWSATVSE
jgi:hypothetical protein